jgi:hypothetical protein
MQSTMKLKDMVNTKSNPTVESKELSLPPGYKPMSVGQRALEVTEKEGWHRHWFRGTPSNIARAQQAGYRFVEKEDVDLNDPDIAGGNELKGTDLGSRVSVISGDDADPTGQPNRLYLMECPENLFEYAQSLLMKDVDMTAEALRGGTIGKGQQGETGTDVANRYLKDGKVPSLFNRKS